MKKKLSGVVAGLVVALASPRRRPAPPTVTVRVEGDSRTLLPSAPGHDDHRPGRPPAADVRWHERPRRAGSGDGRQLGPAARLRRLRGHDPRRDARRFRPTSDYWALWIDATTVPPRTGLCDAELSRGDELLLLSTASAADVPVLVAPPARGSSGVPATAPRGQSVTVRGSSSRADGTARPVDGATVPAGGADRDDRRRRQRAARASPRAVRSRSRRPSPDSCATARRAA